MTSKEIEDSPAETKVNHHEAEQAFWLKEIAYQLAVMNEREKAQIPTDPFLSPNLQHLSPEEQQ